MTEKLANFTDVLGDDEIIGDSQPISLPSSVESQPQVWINNESNLKRRRPAKGTGQYNEFRSVEEIDTKYRDVFAYPFFNLVQSRVIEDALYSDKSMVVCAPTGSGKTVVFEMAIVQLLMEMEEKGSTEDFKIIYMAPVKALCTERLTEWYSRFNKLGLLCIEVTGDTDVDFSQLQAFKIIITTPEKWDMLTRRWKDHRGLVEMIKLFLIDEVHILNDESRGPVLEAVVSRMKTIQSAAQLAHRIEKLQMQYQSASAEEDKVVPRKVDSPPTIRFVAVSATVSNPEDVAAWLKTDDKPAVYYKFGDECRPVKLRRIVEGYPCPDGTSIFKFDIILNYKLWPVIQKYHDGKPTLIFCNTRKSVLLTAETLSREITITFSPEQKAKLTALASMIKNKKLQALVLAGVGCHHAGLLYEERTYIEYAFRNGDLPILITTTTLAMGVNLPAHLVIIKNTQQYVNGAYQEYSISTVLQMVGRAGRPQFDTDATAVIMTRQRDKARYQALAGGSEPLQSYLHKRLAENLNSETALGTVCDVAQCVQWLRSTFLYVRAARDPKRYLGLTSTAPDHMILKKIEEMCVRAMNGLASAGLISMDEASCIASTEAGRLMSVFYLDLETMKLLMKIQGNESLERLLGIICECHELADMHLRTDERRTLNNLNRNNAAATIRFPMKGKISTRQMKLNCIIQAVLGCLPIPEPALNQEAMKIMRIADRVCKCLVAFVTRPEPVTLQLKYFSAVLNAIILAKCIAAHLWENSPYVSKQLKGIGPTFSTLLATAGKINFMLLEESHPRDLERIMNKGPPAGNVLRKQVSLMPKYKLEATPIDERTVSVKLMLLNQAYLSENMESLTAGRTHKCYVIAGDSENYLLLLTTFIDKDLIRVYDGTITYEIKRKHSFEHKITVHCVSSSFVGIDAQCEYTFTNLMPAGAYYVGVDTSSHLFQRNVNANKQTTTVEPAKDRKRKINTDDISQSKQKKKRDNALAEKLRLLKESFGRASTVLKKNLQKTEETTKNVLIDLGYADQTSRESSLKENNDMNTIIIDEPLVESNVDNFPDHDDDIMDDEKINSILNEIETEITKVNTEPRSHAVDSNENITRRNSPKLFDKNSCTIKQNQLSRKRSYKPGNTKSNYEFLDILEKNTDCDEDLQDVPVKDTGFSDAIKLHIENFMQKSHNAPPLIDLTLANACENPDTENTKSVNDDFKNYDIALPENIFQEKNIRENKNTQKEHENLKGESQNYELYKKKNSQSSIDEDLPVINITGPVNDQATFVYSEKNKGETHDNENSRISNNTVREPHNNNEVDKKTTQLITPNNMGLMSDAICYNPTIEGLNGTEEVAVVGRNFANNDNIVKYNSLCRNSNNNLHSVLVPSCTKAAFMSITNRNSMYSTDNDNKVSWSQRQNKIELKPIDKIKGIIRTVTDQTTSLGGYQPTSMNHIQTKAKQVDFDCKINSVATENTSTEYENKYSYTAEKVDVQTKYTDDHKIRIIRRLKVDLDVREIIAKCEFESKSDFNMQEQNINTSGNSYFQDTNVHNYAHNKVTGNQNRIIAKESPKNVSIAEVKDNSNNTDMTDNSQRANNIKPKGPTTKVSTLSDETRMLHYVQKSSDDISQLVNSESKADKATCKEKDIQKIENVQQDNSERSKTTLVGPKTEEMRMAEDMQQNSSDNREQEDASKKKNSIGNILEKYAQMIRKNQYTDVRNVPNLPTSDKKILNSVPFNTNRPFKISEIQNLNLPLSSFCENVVPLPANVSLPGNSKYMIANRIQTPLATLPVVENLPKKTLHHIDINYMDLSPCQSPVQLLEQSLEITEDDLKLDQSMFNPKTLLQNMGKDDNDTNLEIIPPPPEFCNDDDIDYSPETDVNEDLKSSSYFEDLNQTFEERLNTSVLEDVFPDTSNLTPSKEIETWTLDRDSESDTSFQYTTPQSYTVMRRKMFQSYNQSHDSQDGTTRQGKLSQFKFNSKNKLKL